jgi:hypothetical protein
MALAEFRRGGDSEDARQLLTEAKQTNRHVPAYLLGKKQLPKQLPDYIGMGDENEAVAYAAEAMVGWKKTPGAIGWLGSLA